MRTKLLSITIGMSALVASAHPIDFDRIQHWTGTGPNRAALVVQYNGDTYGNDAYVWGYRWEDGEKPTGESMMKAICANSSRLSMLTQYTGSMGSTLCGVGYSLNQEVLNHVFFNFEKATTFEFINFDYYSPNSYMGQSNAPGDDTPQLAQAAIDVAKSGTHYIQHPFDYGTYGYPAYDYDCWDIDEEIENRAGSTTYEPKWLSAWYEGYWSYWCANSPTQDFMYSGSGFTGRTLSDGAVDGWSFTQFESAMVGGMGEGVAPCEDGSTIWYVPSRFTSDIDINKCKRFLGKGTNMLPLIIQTGDNSKIDNMVLGLKFGLNIPEAQEILSMLNVDPAFEIIGETLNIDTDGDRLFNNQYSDVSLTGKWIVSEYEDCVVLSCVENYTPEYLIYLPELNGEHIVLPEEMTFAISDADNYIPVFMQRGEEFYSTTYTWYRRNNKEDIESNNSSDIVKSISNSASKDLGRITYVGNKAGELYIFVKARLDKSGSYQHSNVCHFTLLPPEIPVVNISFSESIVNAPLNSSVQNSIIISPENATYTALTYKSSDTKVATASATAFKTTKTPGSATITVSSTWNPDVNSEFEIVSELRHPMTDFTLREMEVGDDNVIVLNPKQMFGAIFDPVPANADIPDVTVKFEDYGTNKDDYIFSGYKVNYWDENNTRIQFYEVSGHRAGEGKMIVTTTDGSNITKTYTIRVEEQDRTPLENGYTDGTIMLNEEWFGHTNGGLNYITPEGEMMYQVYERENPGMSFGCTSQHATIWADKLIVISKQADDGGDPLRGGGRVVVADAKTLKRLGSVNDLIWGDETRSSDGRAVVGATPSKVYVGSNNGIYIFDIDNYALIGKITDFDETGSTGADLYNGQIGDMVHAGKYVFGIKQQSGAFVINTETDRVVRTYPELKEVQGVTQTADGNIWIADVVDGRGRFTCIDPETLEKNDVLSIMLPASVGYPICGWGAWRNVAFVGSHTTNKIWFNTGGGIAGGSSTDRFFGWEVGTDPNLLTPVFDLGEAKLTGSHKNVRQKTYGTLRYDERSGELFVMTTEDSASGHYRYNWTHFVDPATGEILRTITLRPYYWFQCFPIFPDKYDAVIDIENIEMMVTDSPLTIDLSELVSDADNVNSNIKLSLVDTPELFVADEETNDHATVALNGKTLTITPKSIGNHIFTLAAESNGRTVTKSISVNVRDTSNVISGISNDRKSVECDGSRLYIKGFAESSFRVFDISGRNIGGFVVYCDSYVFDFGKHKGVFILSSEDGFSTKVIIR